MADTAKTGLARGLGVYVGLGAGLLVTGLLLTLVVHPLAADAGIPASLTNARLMILSYVAIAAALAVGGGLWTGSHFGSRNADQAGFGVGLTLLVTIAGTAILLALGWVGLRLGLAAFPPANEATTASVETFLWSLLLVVPALVTGLVASAFAGTFAPTETSAPAPEPDAGPEPAPQPTTEPTPQPSTEPDAEPEAEPEAEPTPEPEPAVGAAAEPEPAAEPADKTLECPACENVFETTVAPGEPIECPDCGYSAKTTAS